MTLFSPADFDKLFPFPIGHPGEKYSQVFLKNPQVWRWSFYKTSSKAKFTVKIAVCEES